MTKTASTALLALALVVIASLGIRFHNQFSRIKQVEIGSTPIQLGSISRIILTNRASSKVDFWLRCHLNTHEEGRAFPSERVVLLPDESREFDVYPDLSPGNLPFAIANKTCTALWQGPLGIERRAWQAHWQYARPPYKMTL